MKKENRKAAQERRAKEREAEERKKKLPRILVPVIVIAALAVLVIGIVVTASHSEDDNVKTSDSAYDSTGSVTAASEAGANTSAVSTASVSTESVVADSTQTAKLGDTVVIDYVGKIDGVAFDGGTAENQTLTLGSGAYIDGFEDQIVGHHPGETFDINVTFPDDYGATDLAGKDAVFTITLDSIQ